MELLQSLFTVGVILFTAYFVLFRGKSAEPAPTTTSLKNETENSKESTETNSVPTKEEVNEVAQTPVKGRVEMRVVYGSTTGTAKRFAHTFASKLPKEAMLHHPSTATGVNQMVKLDVPAPEDADGADPWDMLESSEDADEFLGKTTLVHVIIMSTWTGGVPPMLSKRWFDAFQDMSTDFRVGTSAMHDVRFAVYGLGSSEYDEHWCTAGKQIYDGFLNMGATPLVPFGKGDDTTDMTSHFDQWCEKLIQQLSIEEEEEKGGCCGGGGEADTGCGCNETEPASTSKKGGKKAPKTIKGVPKPKKTKAERRVMAAEKGDANAAAMTDEIEMMQEDEENERLLRVADLEDSDADSDIESNASGEKQNAKKPTVKPTAASSGEGVVDVEDMGKEIGAAASEGTKAELKKSLVDDDADGHEEEGDYVVVSETAADERPEMVTPLQRKALTKEGYKIIGTHSAVKLCRWTKHQLRGRGGCYKHTFYGITSYQCMEATPSLACANKCVFCWRHHKNPVGREWRWKEDSPEDIVKEAIHLHTRMVNEFKGAKGVHADRIEEAMTVRHCALSLVGEPIMYPRINEMVVELHKRHISSFLVTNAQFPEEITNLVPVTQLYVSIDAATKESLKAVDRPLFKDFWERFLACLEELKKKGQRTVYRLTLVKSWNMTEVDQYIDLLLIGEPDLIEIKAVTFCGTSDASSLTMENVPWHHEVVTFAKAIEAHPKLNGMYGLAAVHAHSCCTLLAKKDVYFTAPNDQEEPRWRTWIDYPKFHALEEDFRLNGTPFTSSDYLADTPDWALPDAEEEGFDPVECRVRRNRKGEEVPISYKSSESGCG